MKTSTNIISRANHFQLKWIGLLCLVCAFMMSQSMAQTFTVTSGADSGAGTLRDGLSQAENGLFDRIQISPSVPSITVNSTLTYHDYYNQTKKLRIDGNYHTAIAITNPSATIFHAETRWGIGIYGVRFSYGKGVNIKVNNAYGAGKDIQIDLYDVRVAGSGANAGTFTPGVLIDDTTTGGLTVNSPYSMYSSNTAEGLRVNKTNGNLVGYFYSTDFLWNGYTMNAMGEFHDGVQLCQMGSGNLTSYFYNCVSYFNAEDGLDLDEEGSGNNTAYIYGSQGQYNSNGQHGASITELGTGIITATYIRDATFNYNSNDGVHVNGGGAGNATVTFNNCELNNNSSDGFVFENRGGYGGPTTLTFTNSEANQNGDDGIQADAPAGTIGITGAVNDYHPNGDDDLNLNPSRAAWNTSGLANPGSGLTGS